MVDRTSPDTYFIMYTCTDAAGLKDTKTRTVKVLDDTTPPKIELNKPNTVPEISLNAMNDYVDDLGAMCIDNLDDPKRITGVSAVDKTEIDTYPVTYTCTDQAGNSAIPVTRDVKVVLDANPPRVVFDAEFMDSVQANYPNYDPKTGVDCEDDVAATLHVSNAADLTMSKDYDVVYTCIDTNGNSDAEVRTVTVVAMGTPVITIMGGSVVTEGGNATFTITALPAPSAPITVNLTVSDATSGDFVAPGMQDIQMVIVNSGTFMYNVITMNDSMVETNGEITVTVNPGTGYIVGTQDSAIATVNDDDSPVSTPVVTITGGSMVTEGGNATFTITAMPQPTATITVSLDVEDAGGDSNFVDTADEGSDTVEITTTGPATFSVTTTRDDVDEPDGQITVTVTSGNGYDVGTPNIATVTVNDDDDPTPSLTPPPFSHTATPSLLSFTVDEGSVAWDLTDPSDIRLTFNITAMIDSSFTPGQIFLAAYNNTGGYLKTLSSNGLSDSDSDTNNGVNHAVLAAAGLDENEATSGEIIWLVIDNGFNAYSDPIWIEVPGTGNNVDMTTTPVSGNTAGFPPITRAVINDVSAIPAVHNTALIAKPDLSGVQQDDMYTFESGVESFSDRLRLNAPPMELDLDITGDSAVVISGWKKPTFDEGVVTLFNWNFDSLAAHADIMGVYLANDTHKVRLSGDSSGLVDLMPMKEDIMSLTGDTTELVIKLNGKVDHLCDDITLVADFFRFGQTEDARINDAIYRIEVEEATPNSPMFEATIEYTMLNQLNIDDASTYTGLRTIDSDVSIIVHEDFTDEDSVRVNYLDLGADGVSTR